MNLLSTQQINIKKKNIYYASIKSQFFIITLLFLMIQYSNYSILISYLLLSQFPNKWFQCKMALFKPAINNKFIEPTHKLTIIV